MHIKAKEVSYRKRIGKSGDRAVFGIGTIGGLHLVVAADRAGGFETLGAGSHPGIARHLATRHAENIEYNDLAKSEHLDPRFFEDLLPEWLEETKRLRKLNGDD